MTERYLFADEAGCFTFNREPNISRYFILCTVTTSSLDVGDALHRLRHKLIWEGKDAGDFFHATVQKQEIRDRVFETILGHKFMVQATICEKAKAQPQVRADKARFYKYPWFYHLKHGLARHIPEDTELLVTTASLGTKREKLTFTNALDDVMRQTVRNGKWAVDFRPSQADPCLQLADYCAWAIQRKWERGDTKSYDLIADRITYEFDMWKHGTKLYY
ncbi:DUF3800 domain-containing protein [Aliirhizobium cellulosilyticum]|uniref:DUF3800 domain-containing protein n=1 Tax=Aliirhizobium cellulosilyticum TaxID=393664 RepID=A0A7W6SD72_9HYPH|nr:hypothetical protein [Rhizobium cellulosilyticum]MBB4414846.1 hypothetical protein [Rhizobium cellulosilyticum]MBB4449520.1 hypothetical protein [Rhizobium cellulosilyticum]